MNFNLSLLQWKKRSINLQGREVDEVAEMITLDRSEYVRKVKLKVLSVTLVGCVLILAVGWIMAQRHKASDALMRRHFERIANALNTVVETVPDVAVTQVGWGGGPVPGKVRKLKNSAFTISDLENLFGKPDSVSPEGKSNQQSLIVSWKSWESGWDKKYSGKSRTIKAVFAHSGIASHLIQLEYEEHSPGHTTVEIFGLSGAAWRLIRENY
jgi:hypothetical protein